MQMNAGGHYNGGRCQWRQRKVNPFEGANLTGICDRLAMEAGRKRSVRDDAVVLAHSLMDTGGIP